MRKYLLILIFLNIFGYAETQDIIFNEREKNIISDLVGLDKGQLITLESFLIEKVYDKDKALGLFPDKKTSLLYLKNELFSLPDIVNEIYYFHEMQVLFENLQELRLIKFIPNPNDKMVTMKFIKNTVGFQPRFIENKQKIILDNKGLFFRHPDLCTIYNKNEQIEYKGYNLNDYAFSFLIQNINSYIFVSKNLDVLVDNKFKSVETKRFNKMLFAAWVGIALAMVFGICGLIRSRKTNELKINNSQFGQLLKRIDNKK